MPLYYYVARLQDDENTTTEGIGLIEFERDKRNKFEEAHGFFADKENKINALKFEWDRIDEEDIYLYTKEKKEFKNLKDKRTFVKNYHKSLLDLQEK